MIDVIIPNWNGRKFLKTCFESLQNQTDQSFRVILVDNGSIDNSVSYVQEHFGDLDLICIELPENLGFSAAVNRGIEAAVSDWILLLNNDVEVASDCMKKLHKTCNSPGDYDFFALKMIDYEKRSYLDGAGDAVMRGGVGYRLGTMEQDSSHYQIRREVFGACGGAALYRRSLFAEIGHFDEDFFAYLEDVDFNLRAVKAGKRCCFLPDARIFHIGSGSSGSKINDLTVTLTTRNNIFVVVKNYDSLLFIRFFLPFLVYQLFWFVFVIKKRQTRSYLIGIIKSFCKLPDMYRKRRDKERGAHLSRYEFGNRIISSERQAVESIMNRRTQLGKSNALLALYLKLFCRRR